LSVPPAGWVSSPRARGCAAPTECSSATAPRSGCCCTSWEHPKGVLAWQEQQLRRQMRAGNNGLATFDDPNQRRSATAATATVTSVQAALALLTGQDDEQLLVAGRLRLAHPQEPLEQLGALADPPMTKDAVAGRLRRLLARADRRAVALGLPTTRAAASPGLLPAVDQG